MRSVGLVTGVHPAVAPNTAPSLVHATVLVGILLGMSLAFAVALLDDSPIAAVTLVLVVPVMTGVLSVAWMRPPSRSPEHHPAIDRLLDDTSP
jgi:hypothetical protein